MANTLCSVFDVMNGLDLPTGSLALPHNIFKVQSEHAYALASIHPAPKSAPAVGAREHVRPDTDQHPSQLDNQAYLAHALEIFQELEHTRFGVASRDVSCEPEIIYEFTEDYPSEDESVEDLPPAGEPNPNRLQDLQTEIGAQLQD